MLPPKHPVHSARLRIFTPARELPFAGHPTVGTAVLLATRKAAEGAPGNEMMLLLEETVGPIRCGVFIKGERAGTRSSTLRRCRCRCRPNSTATRWRPRSACSRRRSASRTTSRRPGRRACLSSSCRSAASTPSPMPGRTRRRGPAPSVRRGRPPGSIAARPSTATTIFMRACSRRASASAEDPATGSAAAAFAGVVHRFDELPSGSHRYVIEQGFEMGRPSPITLEIDIAGGDVAAVRIGGNAVVIAEGTLRSEPRRPDGRRLVLNPSLRGVIAMGGRRCTALSCFCTSLA